MKDDYNPIKHGHGDAISPDWNVISKVGAGSGGISTE